MASASRRAELAARREELIARSRSLRGEFREHAVSLHSRLLWAERAVSAARAIRRSGPILLGIGALAVLFGPRRLIRLLGTAYRYAPMALGAFEVARSAVTATQDRPRA